MEKYLVRLMGLMMETKNCLEKVMVSCLGFVRVKQKMMVKVMVKWTD